MRFNLLLRKIGAFVRRGFRSVVRRVLWRVPLAVWRRAIPKPTFGVCYHVVSDTTLRHVKHYRPLNSAQFESDLDYLKRNFDVIGYDEVLRRRSPGKQELDNTVTLTFDDGFAECATVVRPILLRHGVSATFFVITDFIDNRALFRESQASLCIDAMFRRPVEDVQAAIHDLTAETELPWLSQGVTFAPQGFGLAAADLGGLPDPRLRPLLHWLLTVRPEDVDLLDRLCDRLGIDVQEYLTSVRPYLSTDQIRQLHSEGFTIGAHSRSHRRLNTLSPSEAEEEIVESCRIVRDLTGQASVPFAFPYFGGGVDRTWLAQLRRRQDFIGLFFDTGGLREDAPFVVQRVFGERITGRTSLDRILRAEWASH